MGVRSALGGQPEGELDALAPRAGGEHGALENDNFMTMDDLASMVIDSHLPKLFHVRA